PGNPDLMVNVTVEEKVKYSPKILDVINLKTGEFESVELNELLSEYGSEYPGIENIVSEVDDRYLRPPRKIGHDYKSNHHIASFEGLSRNTEFVSDIKKILDVLREKYNGPIDIEFASDGTELYILQCRPQSFTEYTQPAQMPDDIFERKQLFSSEKHVPNGLIQDITHIVYVDPEKYSETGSYEELVNVGRIIGRLNKVLPKRQFVLMGPGRWGSRGDIKLGVSVTYSDINNSAMLIEIAKKRKDRIPDLSFGTHFFQDLVEANIKYLPLYPDDSETYFNDDFFTGSKNHLSQIVTDPGSLEKVVRLIDVAEASKGNNMHIYMNSDLQKAVAVLSEPSGKTKLRSKKFSEEKKLVKNDVHWKWRLTYAQEIANSVDTSRFGVKAFYIFGSVKNATAGPMSDIDIIIHFSGSKEQKHDLKNWLEGWDQCLKRVNFYNTGHDLDSILDIHFVTDKDIKNKTSYAIKIGAVTDPARPLQMKKKKSEG
ncbi:MAG: PEP/pyruvate-binding domain-containing protein, partial [Candidatus Delongbacteria bacterium]